MLDFGLAIANSFSRTRSPIDAIDARAPPSQDHGNQKKSVWAEVILSAEDQLCQKMGWALQKIFATSTGLNTDARNSEANLGVLDNFVSACFSTYKDVITRASFNEEMVRVFLSSLPVFFTETLVL